MHELLKNRIMKMHDDRSLKEQGNKEIHKNEELKDRKIKKLEILRA